MDSGTVEFTGELTVKSVSGNWFIRHPEHPYTEFILVKQVKLMNLGYH